MPAPQVPDSTAEVGKLEQAFFSRVPHEQPGSTAFATQLPILKSRRYKIRSLPPGSCQGQWGHGCLANSARTPRSNGEFLGGRRPFGLKCQAR
jgi:hypothetical protein